MSNLLAVPSTYCLSIQKTIEKSAGRYSVHGRYGQGKTMENHYLFKVIRGMYKLVEHPHNRFGFIISTTRCMGCDGTVHLDELACTKRFGGTPRWTLQFIT